MANSKSLTIVAASTILFGVISKRLAGIPYMSLKHFDLYFVISFLLCAIYSASLYVAGKIKCNGNSDITFWKCDDDICIYEAAKKEVYMGSILKQSCNYFRLPNRCLCDYVLFSQF